MNPSGKKIIFNDWLDRVLEKHGLDASEIARMSGVSPSYISMIRRGQRTNVSPKTKDRLVNAVEAVTGEPASIVQSPDEQSTTDHYPDLSTAQLWRILNDLPIKFYIKDMQRRFTFMNRKTLQTHKFESVKEALGKTDSDLFTSKHAEKTMADEEKLLRTGVAIIDQIEEETWPDKTITSALTSKLPLLNLQDEIIGLYGITKDTTDSSSAYEILKKVFNILPQCVFLKNRDGQITECNDSFSAWHRAYLGIENVVGMTDHELWVSRPELAKGFVSVDTVVMNTGKPSGLINEKHVFPDGSERMLETYKFPLFERSGNVVGLIGIYTDITERFHQDKQAKDIARTVGHALKTWMGVLEGNTRILQETIGDNEAVARLAKGIAMLRHMANITSYLASIDAITSYVRVDIVGLISRQAELMSPLKVEIESPAGFEVDLSEGHFSLAVVELLANAQRFAACEGHVKIRFESQPGRCRVHISDNGPGVAGRLKGQALFEEGTTTEGSEHTGLGLHFVKRVVDMHRGTIQEIGVPGEGAHFVIDLPLTRGE